MTEASKQHNHLIYNWWIEVTLFVSWLSSNLSHILWNIPTAVDIRRRRHGCNYIVYARLVVIDLRIGTKLFCGRSEII